MLLVSPPCSSGIIVLFVNVAEPRCNGPEVLYSGFSVEVGASTVTESPSHSLPLRNTLRVNFRNRSQISSARCFSFLFFHHQEYSWYIAVSRKQFFYAMFNNVTNVSHFRDDFRTLRILENLLLRAFETFVIDLRIGFGICTWRR